ncbi:MAG: nuclear transport factor 2 family protein [Pseudomonadota bacterium]
MDATDYAKTLQGLIDKDEIEDLIKCYCDCFDRAQAEEVIALFTDDAVIDYGPDVPVMTGPQAFGPMIRKGLSEFFAATSHHVSNVQIQFDGPDRARSVCYLYAWHRYQGSGVESELWGRYEHVLHRLPLGWRIARLRLTAAGTRNFHRENMHPIGRHQG